jgi:hypothetical protein
MRSIPQTRVLSEGKLSSARFRYPNSAISRMKGRRWNSLPCCRKYVACWLAVALRSDQRV